MEYSLFAEASRDLEDEARQLRTAKVRADMQGEIFPFLALAASTEEYEHRKALAYDSLTVIASRHGASLTETEEIADRMFSVLAEARVQAAAMVCKNCGHRSSPHSEGGTCTSCGCTDFTPKTTAAKEARRVTADEGDGPFM